MTATSRSMPGKKLAAARDRLGDRERVLEQPVAVGLVVDLRRRRVAEAGPDRRALAEEAVEQLAQLRVLDRREQLAQVALEALDGDLRLGREVLRLVLARRRPRAASPSLIFAPQRSLTSKTPVTKTAAPGAASA